MKAPPFTEPLMVFVPLDPRTLTPETESVFLEAFAGSLAGVVLGGLGIEWLAHVVDMHDLLGQIQDSVRPQISQVALAQAIQAYRLNPRPFPPGQVPGIWVPVLVPSLKMDAVMAKLYPELGLNWRLNPPPHASNVPWRRRSAYRPQLRPRWC